MEIKFYGANCLRFSNKKVSVVLDDTADKGKFITTDKDIVLQTNKLLKYGEGGYFTIDMPGEYEVSEVSVAGISSKLHLDEAKTTTLYAMHFDGITVAILGHTKGDLTEDQLEKLGVVDVLVVPVGGHGYTLDAVAATKLVKEIEPKVVIPTHYDDSSVNYEVPQSPVEEFLKSFGASDVQYVDALKIKDGTLPEKTQVYVLANQ